MEILRAASAKLDPETVFVMTYQYHTEKDPDDPNGKKKLRAKSRYRMLGRIEKLQDLEAKMAELRRDENRLSPWKWPDDPSWDGKILYAKDASSAGRSNWIRLKINKAVSWDNMLLLMQGVKKDTKKDSRTFEYRKSIGIRRVTDKTNRFDVTRDSEAKIDVWLKAHGIPLTFAAIRAQETP